MKGSTTPPHVIETIVRLHESDGLGFDVIGKRIGKSTGATWQIYKRVKRGTKRLTRRAKSVCSVRDEGTNEETKGGDK